MARKALTFLCCILVVGGSGCQTAEQRVIQAAKADGEAKAKPDLPDLPPECTAKVGRVKLGDDPWVVLIRRWEILAENRDQKSIDCAAWWADYRVRMSKTSPK